MTVDNAQFANRGSGQLSETKQRLLEKYLRVQGFRDTKGRPVIPRRPAGTPIPLSFPQQQVWVHSQMVEDVPIYNEAITIYRHGLVDVSVLERCLVEAIRRHEIWRTTFESIDGKPVQIVQPFPDRFPLAFTDLRHLRRDERETEAARLATADARKPFDLKTGPLLRAILVQIDDAEYRLYMTFHQIVFDAVSAYRVFLPELSSMYEAFSARKPSPLPEPTLQYGDFAHWQQKTFAGDAWAGQSSFWRKKLSGELPVLPWPTDHTRPVRQSHRGAVQRFQFDPVLVQRLKIHCRQEGISSYMALLASYLILLSRYTGQEDIVLGGISARRKRPEIESLVGDFVNPLALRVDLSGNPTFRELSKRVMRVVLDALANDDVPFERIVEELRLRPNSGRNPIFQIIFSQQPQLPSLIPGWGLATEEVSNGGSKMDMMIVVDERQDAISGPITYNPDLFDASTLKRMLDHWQTLLRGALASPESHISELPLLTSTERDQLQVEWNDTALDYPKDVCLYSLIESQVERTPDALAVEFEGKQLSYRELNERANQLACHLRDLGVGPEVLVGISMERSLDMIVALLGVMKAGGAYVPLDPSYPRERLTFMVQDSELKILLIQESLAGLWAGSRVELVCVDRDWPLISRRDRTNQSIAAVPANLVYVLYTSGSAGRPKGVEIPHSAVVNFLLSMQRKPGFTAKDTLLAVTTLSFDIAGLELYLPLVSGGRVVIASREDAYDPARLMERMRESRCNVMQATPATWRTLVDAGWSGSPDLKLLCGGESLAQDLAKELLPCCRELWNMYGPTETTIWSMVFRVLSADTPIPIGEPIANTEVFVLDSNLNLLPVGAVGELYIGGAGLARGYLHRAELTQERFIPSPFQAGARIYRTGDLARRLSDGSVECLGRADDQVKLRGFRIELGEIEAVLGRHKGVRQCVVAARKDTQGQKQLVAYLEPGEGPAVDDGQLRAHLKRELPDYMIPSVFLVLDKFPLTPNGKVDRKALPAPGQSDIAVQEDFVAPRDPLELALAHLWTKVLKVKRVGLRDNFFELGGHSLLAVRLIVEIEKLCGRRLPLAVLLQAQTVGDLAEVLQKENWKPSWFSLVPLRAEGSRPPLFLMHAHGGNVLEYHALVNHLNEDQPAYALQSRSLDGHIRKGQSLDEMTVQYVKELRSLQPEGPYYLAGFCLGGLLALEAARQLTAAGEKVALLALIQTMHPAFARFKPGLKWYHRWWYKTRKRIDLEHEHVCNRGKAYIRERLRRFTDIVRARTAIRFDDTFGISRERLSMPYILEAITIENDRAARQYGPHPYHGDVLLFRASKQLTGLAIDEYLGWRAVFQGNLAICEIPGHQENMLLEPNVLRVAAELTDRLLAAQERHEVEVEVA
jgi:surfactin family lipopeptide synthetase A